MLTTIIIVFTVFISIICFNDLNLREKLIFYPNLIYKNKEYYRFISSGFIHANWMHLLFNLITLYSFGNEVEYYFSLYFGKFNNLLYLLLYLGGMVAADVSCYFRYKNSSIYRSLGASGAVSAVLFASIIFNPWNTLLIYFIPIPAVIFGVLYLLYCVYAARNVQDNINHEAHFYGAIFGVVFVLALKPSLAIEFVNKITGN